MSSSGRCQECGTEVRSDLIDGLCPKCVAGLTLQFESTPSDQEESVAGSGEDFDATESGAVLSGIIA